MQYFEHIPQGPIRSIVKCFWAIRSNSDGVSPPEPVLPDGCPEIVFNLADRFERIGANGEIETQGATIVSGQIRQRILIRPTGRVDLFGVRFHPYAGEAFLRLPMSGLTDHVLPLDAVMGADSAELEDRISNAITFNERVNVFNASVLGRMNISLDQRLAGSITERILNEGGRLPISEIKSWAGIGERRLERIFQRCVGVSPKTFSRIVRFQALVRHIESTATRDMTDAALAFGYYDQPHMIHEFNEFASLGPTAYFDRSHRISELFTSAA